MEKLPVEIINIIYDFTPSECKKNLSKKLFKTHYFLETKEKMINKRYYNYLRYLINNKCVIHVDIALHIFSGHFLKIKNWRYKNKTYPNFLVYLKDFALEKQSQICYHLIMQVLEPSKKNKYKRIRTRNIRWTN